MKLRRIDPRKITIPEVRVTAQFDEETLAMFKASIKEVGQIAPIICCQVDGDFVLVDGLHRLEEALQNGVPHIDVVLTDGDMVDVLTKNIFLDHLRGKTPVSEMRKVILALYKEYQVGIEDIVKRTGLTRDYVEKLLLISELTPKCLEALDQGRIGVGHAAALTKIKEPDRQEVILNQQLTYRWTVKVLEDYIKEVLSIVAGQEQKPVGEVVRQPVLVKCQFCGIEYPANELASVITCRECSGIMFQAIGQAKREAEKMVDSVPNPVEVP